MVKRKGQTRRRLTGGYGVAGLVAVICLAGCAVRPMNPSFPLTSAEAETAIVRMEDQPRELARPVVVLTGWADPFFGSMYWKDALRDVGADPEQVLPLSFLFNTTFEGCRRKVVRAVERRWPSDDPTYTVEVDVIGFSMGGLVARVAAAPSTDAEAQGVDAKRLRIARLFTIATPHRGARLSAFSLDPIMLDRRIVEMRSQSDTLVRLDKLRGTEGNDYLIIPYARSGDWVIGDDNAAPPGVVPWWVPTPPLHRPHQEAYRDARIEADILRRLRGEPPWTTDPPTDWP
jgi:hypothetical protein